MSKEGEPIRTIVMILIGLLPAALELYRTGDIQALSIVGFLFLLLSTYFIYDWTRSQFEQLERRIEVLELRSKGAIDPRNVILVLMIILFLLYLRVAGFI